MLLWPSVGPVGVSPARALRVCEIGGVHPREAQVLSRLPWSCGTHTLSFPFWTMRHERKKKKTQALKDSARTGASAHIASGGQATGGENGNSGAQRAGCALARCLAGYAAAGRRKPGLGQGDWRPSGVGTRRSCLWVPWASRARRER